MDKNTLSNYGWIVIAVLVLSVMIALATPFGTYVKTAVENTTEGLFDVQQKAMGVAGLVVEDQNFESSSNATYEMLDGDSQNLTQPATLSFRSSANISQFDSVKVNGQTISSENYTVTEGSTIVTLNRNYVALLENGTYSIEIVSSDGSATCDFSIEYEEFTFYIGDEAYTAKRGWTWADWILSYNCGAGDNGIVWIGYDEHPNMEFGYLYYMIEGNALGDNKIELNGTYSMYNDLIQETTYNIDGPT